MPRTPLFDRDQLTVLLASDHAGFELKNLLRDLLKSLGWKVKDLGPFSYEPEDDYPLFISRAAEGVSADPENNIGIILGGSGEGEAMVANRFPNVRATVYYGYDLSIVTLGRQHNNSNILSLGARFLTLDLAKAAVELWLTTPFSNEVRHARRIEEIETLRTGS